MLALISLRVCWRYTSCTRMGTRRGSEERDRQFSHSCLSYMSPFQQWSPDLGRSKHWDETGRNSNRNPKKRIFLKGTLIAFAGAWWDNDSGEFWNSSSCQPNSADPLFLLCLASLTFVFVFDEALEDEDEVEVVLCVTQRQHGDASHAWILLLRCQRWTECLCRQDTLPCWVSAFSYFYKTNTSL